LNFSTEFVAMLRRAAVLLACLILIPAGELIAQQPAFRTPGGDPKLPWYQLQPGVFPPAGSSRTLSGELIEIDPVNRRGILRVDRADDQSRPQWDRPLPFAMLPFGSVVYHGAPAELRDVPLGTHLWGEFYEGPPIEQYRHRYGTQPSRSSPYQSFSQVVRLEDDFSRSQRLGRQWRIESVDLAGGILTVLGIGPENQADAEPQKLFLGPYTRIWRGRGLVELADLAPGQTALINLTVCTLKGPGRAADIWLDAESQALAARLQLAAHHRYQREHGLAGWIESVDNRQGVINVILFGGIDPKLFEEFSASDTYTAAVAEATLRTYDQINDRKAGPGSAKAIEPQGLGHGGMRVSLRPSELLEGFRPLRIVRIWPSAWPVSDLPAEEQLYPR
jgi:hypothetical protein